MAEEKKGLARRYFSGDLLQDIDDWKAHRNKLIHALLKRNLHTEDLKQIAEEGQRYVKAMCSKATSFRRAMEKQAAEK